MMYNFVTEKRRSCMDRNDVNVSRGENLPKKQFIAFIAAAYVIASFAVGVAGGILSFLFFISSVATGAYLFCFSKPYLPIICSLVSLVPVFLLADSKISVAVSLLVLFVSLAIGICAKTKSSLVGSVAAGSAVVVAALICAFLAQIYITDGALSVEGVIKYSETSYNQVVEMLRASSVYTNGDTKITILTEEAISFYARYAVATSFAFLVCIVFLLVYLCAKLFTRLSFASSSYKLISPEMFFIDMSLAAAALFIIATVMVSVLSYVDSAEPVYYAAMNIQIILTPGLTVVGFRSFRMWLAKKTKRRFSFFGWITVAVAAFILLQYVATFLSLAIMVFSIVGAISVIRRKAPALKPKKD